VWSIEEGLAMADDTQHQRNKADSSSKQATPAAGGDAVQNAEKWGGGSKGAKGPVTPEDKRNQNSSAKS
jgi:hypothetical protein